MNDVQNQIDLQIQKDILTPTFSNEISYDYESNVVYCQPSFPNEIATISNLTPFPCDIATIGLRDSKQKKPQQQTQGLFEGGFNNSEKNEIEIIPKNTFYGCIPEIGRFYYVVENKLFLWKIDNAQDCQQQVEEDPIITGIELMTVSPNLMVIHKDATNVLAIATSHYIKFVIVNSGNIDFECFYKANINFPVFCMKLGFNGTLLVGSDRGNVYWFDFDNDNNNYMDKAHTKSLFKTVKQFFLGNMSPNFVNMTIDSSMNVLGIIDEEMKLSFLSVSLENFSFTKLSCSIPDEYHFVSLSYLPYNCVSSIIGFCDDGRRVMFGFKQNYINIIEIKSVIPPPPEFNGHTLKYGFTVMGLTLFFCEDNLILVLRAQRSDKLHHFYEFVYPIEHIGTTLSFGLNFLDFEVDDPFLWQHTQNSPLGYVLTTKGSYNITFSMPCESIRTFLFPNKELDIRYGANNIIANFLSKKSIRTYFELFDNLDETAVNSILLCSLYPDSSKYILSIITQYFNQQISKYEYQTKVSEGFYIRVARILSKIWCQPLFTKYTSKKDEEKWMINNFFSYYSKTAVFHLQKIQDFIKQYLEIRESSVSLITKEQNEKYVKEKHSLCDLNKFISTINDIFTFIGYLSQQKKRFITEIIKKLIEDNSNGNSLNEIDYETKKFSQFKLDTLIEIIQNISFIIFTCIKLSDKNIQSQVQLLAQSIIEHCPTLFKVNNRLINSAISFIVPDNTNKEGISFKQDETQPIFSIGLSTNIFIQYISEISKENLYTICSNLLKMNEIKSTIDIVEAKINLLDKYHRALKWVKKGSDPNDDKGKKIYDEIYEYYSVLFDIISLKNGLSILLEYDDELLHRLIYQHLLDTGREMFLLDIQSKYINDFIKNEARALYWKYLIRKHKTEEAIDELIEISKLFVNCVDKEQINEWLSIAKKYARSILAEDKINEIEQYSNLIK